LLGAPQKTGGGGMTGKKAKAPRMRSFFRSLKALARRILPPRVVAALRILLTRRPITYSDPYPSWAAAKRDAIGYDDPAILKKIKAAALTVKEGRAAFEEDSLAHTRPGFRWPLLACLLHAAPHGNTSRGRTFHVLDFGGSLGSVYFQHRVFFRTMPTLLWSVVEQPHFVGCGNAEFADERLNYFNTIEEAAARAPIDVALFSGSLGYLDAPYDVLTQIGALNCAYLILDRLQVSALSDDQFKVQRAVLPFYSARLAVRFFSPPKLLAHLSSIGYAPIAALPNGFFFERKLDPDFEVGA
jgi:putative methyltransferase (TIGR04325 family)